MDGIGEPNMKSLLLAAALAAFSLSAVAQTTPPRPQTVISGPSGATIVQGRAGVAATVATLPTCNANLAGIGDYYVTDATTPTYNGALTGGSNVVVRVFCNGTAWTSQ
jgi:hypothetical protein